MCPLLCILSSSYLQAGEDGPSRDKHPVSSLLYRTASRCGAAKNPSCEMDGAGGAPKLGKGREGAVAGNFNEMLGSVPWTSSSSLGLLPEAGQVSPSASATLPGSKARHSPWLRTQPAKAAEDRRPPPTSETPKYKHRPGNWAG